MKFKSTSNCLKGAIFFVALLFIISVNSYGQYTYSENVGTLGTGNLQFDQTEEVAIVADGRVYIADRNNDRIQVLNSDFTYHNQFGTFNTGAGQFENPVEIYFDDSGRIYLMDINPIAFGLKLRYGISF